MTRLPQLGPEIRVLDDMLAARAASAPEALAFAAAAGAAAGGERSTYGELHAAAGTLAVGLAQAGVAPGDRVVMLLPAGLGFVRVFYALQRAGAAPCALSPGLPPPTAARHAARVRPRVVVTADPALAAACAGAGLRAIDPAALDGAGAAPARRAAVGGPDSLAFLQATSGTSGEPRAAMILQSNALAALAAARDRLGLGPTDVLVGWVPPWHDLGLLRFVLGPVYCGAPCHLVPPAIRTIPLWLRTAAAVRATVVGAPDFAYRLAARMVDPAGLDLSALRYATNGGEPVRRSTIAAFEERFGLPGVVRPGYGLAEATLGVTCLAPGEPLRSDARGNVSCGRPLPGVEVRIAPAGGGGGGGRSDAEAGGGADVDAGAGSDVDAGAGLDLETGAGLDVDAGAGSDVDAGAGEILVRGPGVFAGYFDAPEESREVLRGGWLHTGDLGAVDADGHLYVLGRLRAMLKRGGAPLAPREIEEAAEQVPGVRLAAALGLPPRAPGAAGDWRPVTEEIALVLEAEASWDGSLAQLVAAAAAAVAAVLGLAPDRVLVVAPRTMARTANGKLRHAELRRALLSADLAERGLVLFDSRRPAG